MTRDLRKADQQRMGGSRALAMQKRSSSRRRRSRSRRRSKSRRDRSRGRGGPEICNDFKRGHCARGDRCRFVHEGAEKKDWECKCGVLVMAGNDVCAKCGEANPNARSSKGGFDALVGGPTLRPAPPSGGLMFLSGGIVGAGKPGDWTCPTCGMNVFASKPNCFRCGTVRERAPAIEAEGKGTGKGDWVCGTCGMNVFANKSMCFRCGTNKDGTVGGDGSATGKGDNSKRPNDWDCPNCGVHVYAWKNQCFRCGTFRPAELSGNNDKGKGGGCSGSIGPPPGPIHPHSVPPPPGAPGHGIVVAPPPGGAPMELPQSKSAPSMPPGGMPPPPALPDGRIPEFQPPQPPPPAALPATDTHGDSSGGGGWNDSNGGWNESGGAWN